MTSASGAQFHCLSHTEQLLQAQCLILLVSQSTRRASLPPRGQLSVGEVRKPDSHTAFRCELMRGWPQSTCSLARAPLPLPRLQPRKTTTSSHQSPHPGGGGALPGGVLPLVRFKVPGAVVRCSFESQYREGPLGGDTPHQSQGEVSAKDWPRAHTLFSA